METSSHQKDPAFDLGLLSMQTLRRKFPLFVGHLVYICLQNLNLDPDHKADTIPYSKGCLLWIQCSVPMRANLASGWQNRGRVRLLSSVVNMGENQVFTGCLVMADPITE